MKNLQGRVTSLKLTKTATVRVERMWLHPLYQKSVKRNKNYACDYDPAQLKLAEGDLVEIQETRPISKSKTFKVVRNLGK